MTARDAEFEIVGGYRPPLQYQALMTLRIGRISGRRGTRIRLSGEFRAEHIDQVKAELRSGGPPVALDLNEVDLVDVECIRFLNACEAGGISALRCSPYIRAWMSRERGEKGH
jgi:hypothetical protein